MCAIEGLGVGILYVVMYRVKHFGDVHCSVSRKCMRCPYTGMVYDRDNRVTVWPHSVGTGLAFDSILT